MSAAMDHPEELITAYLDGELDTAGTEQLEFHLQGCGSCRDAIDGERRIRDLLRGLGPVEPPFGFYERLVHAGPASLGNGQRANRRFRLGLANMAAAAAAWLLVLGVARFDHHDPSPIDASDVISQSASIVPGLGGAPSRPASPQEKDAARSHGVPERLGGVYDLIGFDVVNGQPTARYGSGDVVLTVFVVPGRLDWRQLPEPRPALVNGAPAWEISTDDAEVILVQRPDAVVVVVGPPAVMNPDMAGGLEPATPTDSSLLGRLEEAGRGLLDSFGLRG